LWDKDHSQYQNATSSSLILKFRIVNREHNELLREQMVSQGQIAFTAIHPGYHTICMTPILLTSDGFEGKPKIKLEFELILPGKGATKVANKQERLTEIGEEIHQLIGKVQDLQQVQ
jgi:hypothetical protein